MYLKRVIIKNYRSIRDQEIVFTSGKNIIIGRNNAGKSNIVKAIDIVLGEASPNYARSENITEKDFYTFRNDKGVFETSNELIIYCELERNKGETIDYSRFNGTGAKFCRNRQTLDDIDKFAAFSYDLESVHRNDKIWIDSKSVASLQTEFDDKYLFGFAIMATREGLSVYKNIRFFINSRNTYNGIFAILLRSEMNFY